MRRCSARGASSTSLPPSQLRRGKQDRLEVAAATAPQNYVRLTFETNLKPTLIKRGVAEPEATQLNR
jgi:hypothetical protein